MAQFNPPCIALDVLLTRFGARYLANDGGGRPQHRRGAGTEQRLRVQRIVITHGESTKLKPRAYPNTAVTPVRVELIGALCHLVAHADGHRIETGIHARHWRAEQHAAR